MTDAVYTKFYNGLPVNRGEIFRYMGLKKADEKVASLVEECLSEVLPNIAYKVCYRQFAIYVEPCKTDLSFMVTHSRDLSRNLRGCEKAVVFAATIGMETDRLIARYGRFSPTKALCFQAIGAERIESLCDAFNRDMNKTLAEDGFFARPRFSPGYGDFPLETQKEFFAVLDCYRKIGLSLNDSLLMSPSKSVTALIGYGRKAPNESERADSAGKTASGGKTGSAGKTESDRKIHSDVKSGSDGKAGESYGKNKCQSCENKNCSFRR